MIFQEKNKTLLLNPVIHYFRVVYFSGQFTLRDMYEQFQNIMKMGPFSQIMVRNETCCIVDIVHTNVCTCSGICISFIFRFCGFEWRMQ